MKCPYCSFDNADNATHCKVCGNAISANNTSATEENNNISEETTPDDSSNEASPDEPHQSRIDKEIDENPLYDSFDKEDHNESSSKKGIIIGAGVIGVLIAAFLMKNLFFSNDKAPVTEDGNGNDTPSVVIDSDDTTQKVSEDGTSTGDESEVGDGDTSEESSTWPPANFDKDKTDNQTGNSSTNTSSNHSSNNNQESAMPLVGYKSSGNFDGGIDSGTQILSGLRHGLHPNFERLVLDFTTSDAQPITSYAAPMYTATLNGNIIEIDMQQVIKFSNTIPKITQNSDIKKMEVINSSDGKSTTLKITLKSNGRKYKVFDLKDNGRIVLDID